MGRHSGRQALSGKRGARFTRWRALRDCALAVITSATFLGALSITRQPAFLPPPVPPGPPAVVFPATPPVRIVPDMPPAQWPQIGPAVDCSAPAGIHATYALLVEPVEECPPLLFA